MACVIKNITLVNDTSRVIRMTIVNDASSYGVTYNHHSDDSRGVIYIPREHLYYRQGILKGEVSLYH